MPLILLLSISASFCLATDDIKLYYFKLLFLAPRPEQVWAAHDGPISSLQRSPFFRDIILTVGGWTFAIWKESVTVQFLVFTLKCHRMWIEN